MATSDDQPLQPGKDSEVHTTNLQQGIAESVSQATGAKVESAQVTPPADQHPLSPKLQDLSQEPQPERDFEDVLAGERGRPRTEPAKNFLKLFFERLKKKNPGGTIKEEG